MRNGVSSFLATHTQYLIICESQVAVIPNFCRFHYFEPKCQYFSYGWWYFCFPTWETYLLKQTLKRGMNTSVTNKKKKECICKWLALDKYHGTTKLQMHGMMMIHEQKEVILSCQGLWTSLSVSSNSLKSRICKTDTQTGLKIQP